MSNNLCYLRKRSLLHPSFCLDATTTAEIYTLSLHDALPISGRVTGYTGCNMLNGGWHVEGATIRVGPLVTTKRACAGPENDIERRLLATIGGVVTREGDRLVFTGANGERFEFMPAAAS